MLSQLSMTGYSDRINHALAFAAKHHDQQVRRGVRLPYLTHPPNVAIILTRYGQSDDTVIAGILLTVAKDYVAEGHSTELISHRLGEKFGAGVLETMLAAVPPRVNSAGVELSSDERLTHYLGTVAQTPDAARWVMCADALHDAATLLADIRRTIDRSVVWERRGGVRSVGWFRDLVRTLRNSGFTGAIADELQDVVEALEASR
ncbi:MAG: HD domain-containing protein [Gemmatimonadaceae bacterium]